MATIDALVTPKLLKWARETARLRVDEAAKKIGVTEEQIIAWEGGDLRPTLRYARIAAKKYGRPLAVFYLEEPPRDFSVIKDFRSLRSESQRGVFSYRLALLIRDIQARQAWVREILEELGYPRLRFVGSARPRVSPKALAASIRQTLRLSLDEQLSWRTMNDALNSWIGRVEAARLFVCQTSARGEISPETDARGFAVIDAYAPFIFLNAKDSLGGRIFTLAHELAHVWIAAPGVSNGDLSGDVRSEEGRIEVFCNRVASEVVLPEQMFSHFFPTKEPESQITARIASTAKKIGVSRDVIARRLLDQNMLSRQVYMALHEQYMREWKADQQRQQSGGNYYVNHVRALSKSFVRLVGDVYSRGRITGAEASGILEAKLDKLLKLIQHAHEGSAI